MTWFTVSGIQAETEIQHESTGKKTNKQKTGRSGKEKYPLERKTVYNPFK